MTYTLYYVSQDVTDDGATSSTWSVWREQYASVEADEPIEGTAEHIAQHPNQREADAHARVLQRDSYSSIRCQVCGECVSYGAAERTWFHVHSGDIYCGTGDGAMVAPQISRHARF